MSLSTPIPTNYTPQQAALAAELVRWSQQLQPLVRARVAADQAVASAKAAYENARVAADLARAAYEDAHLVAGRCASAEFDANEKMCERIEQYAPDWDAAGQMLALNRYANSLRCKMALDDDPELPAKLATAEGEMIEFMNVEDTVSADKSPERGSDHVPLHDDAPF